MGTHSVEDHLKLDVKDYDVIIRTLVPHYAELLSTGVEILEKFVAKNARILDLGCGTGRLSEAILKRLPESRLELLDIDPKILDQARGRFGQKNSKIKFRLGSFFDPLPPSEAIVASLSLHHVSDAKEKLKVYKNIYSSLEPGGLFLNLDASVCADPKVSGVTFERWTEHMVKHGISAEEAHRHLANWREEEHYYPLHEELNALASVGFKNPECFWRREPMAIYGALKEN